MIGPARMPRNDMDALAVMISETGMGCAAARSVGSDCESSAFHSVGYSLGYGRAKSP